MSTVENTQQSAPADKPTLAGAGLPPEKRRISTQAGQTKTLLPQAFAWVQGKTSTQSVSLDPEDKESKFYVPAHHNEHH